jgi:hypothetical protein
MFHDLIKAYADAMYVATTLRLPVSVAPAPESECLAEGEERRRAGLSGRRARGIGGWLRTRLGRRFGTAAAPTPSVRPSFVRARHP